MSAIQFTIASGECPQGKAFNPCDDSVRGGLCAYSKDQDMSWCCNVETPVCGRWGEECSGSGNFAGPGQIYCRLDDETWCCNSEMETCVQDPGIFNLCRTKFKNPYSDVSKASALSIKSAYFATASETTSSEISSTVSSTISTTSSTTSTSTQTTASNSASQTVGGDAASQNTPSNSASSTNNASHTPSSSLSGGAIAGIVIGVLGLLILLVTAFLLVRRQRSKKEVVETGGGYQVAPRTELDATTPWNNVNKEAPGDGVHEVHRSELPS